MRTSLKIIMAMAALITLLLLAGGESQVAAQTYEFKISVDTVPNHPRNMGLEIFCDMITKRSNARLQPKVYHSAQLYKDTHVLKAVSMGTVEMAVPGNWQLEGLDVNASLTFLPMFFGQPPEVTEKLVDGEFGKSVSESLAKKMNVKILGRWYELGYVQMHSTTRKIEKIEDLKGLKMRYFAGAVNAERLKALGASPVMISWADVPMALLRGTCDGLITTFKSAEGAKLDEAGLKYSIKSRDNMGYYVPMVSMKFWNSLPADLQKIMEEAWTEHVPKQREIARQEQKEAEDYLKKKGVHIYEPSDAELAKWRDHIMPSQEPFVKKVGMAPELIAIAKKMLGM